jgi:dTDP-4-amino-4,6-dideoxygalactose transaminase
LSQLKKINNFLRIRKNITEKYNTAFGNTKEIILPKESEYAKSAWHIYPIQIVKGNRKKIFDALQKQGIGAQVHYMPLHLHPFYKKEFGYKKGDFPAAEKYYERAITLPLFPKMADKNILHIIKSVKKLLDF